MTTEETLVNVPASLNRRIKIPSGGAQWRTIETAKSIEASFVIAATRSLETFINIDTFSRLCILLKTSFAISRSKFLTVCLFFWFTGIRTICIDTAMSALETRVQIQCALIYILASFIFKNKTPITSWNTIVAAEQVSTSLANSASCPSTDAFIDV